MSFFRRFSKTQEALKVIGVYDVFTAMLAEKKGADALWISSYAYSASQGLPDLGLLPFCSEISVISRIVSSTKIPIVVDIDNGFCEAKHASVIASTLYKAGVSAICIEDKLGAKISSLYDGEQKTLNEEAYVEIISTIKERVPDLNVWARLEGLNYGESNEEIQSKINALYNIDVHGIAIHNTTQNVHRLIQLIESNQDKNIILIPTSYMESVSKFSKYSVFAYIYANQMLRAQHSCVNRVLDTLLKKPEEIDRDISSVEQINKVIGYE